MKDLSALTTKDGHFTIAAFDHRGSLQELLNPAHPDQVTDEQMQQLKGLFVDAFADISSAILIDPLYGPPVLESHPIHTGLFMSLEKTGYTDSPDGRTTELLENWGVSHLKQHNAAAKILLYYHPDAPNAAAQLDLIKNLSIECQEQNVVFLIEPIIYGLDTYQQKDKLAATLTTIDQLTPLVDILKLEFPLDVATTTLEDWQTASAAITEHATVPWILLSRGMDYDHFKTLTEITGQAGGSGIAVGRAVWQEIKSVVESHTDDPFPAIKEFLMTTARDRMQELVKLVATSAKPWTRYNN